MAAAVALAGCATADPTPTETVRLAAEPAGATARLQNGTSCTTPCDVALERLPNLAEDATVVRFDAPQCQPLYTTVIASYGPRPDTWFSYADYHMRPNPLVARLQCGS